MNFNRILLTNNDAYWFDLLTNTLKELGVSITAAEEFHQLIPYVPDNDNRVVLETQAALVPRNSGLPTIACDRWLVVDPFLEFDCGTPLWHAPLSTPENWQDFLAIFCEANEHLNSGAYFGPEDRGVRLQTTVCLAKTGGSASFFEGQVCGQLRQIYVDDLQGLNRRTREQDFLINDKNRRTATETKIGEDCREAAMLLKRALQEKILQEPI